MKRYVQVFCSLALLMVDSCAMAALFTVVSAVENMENRSPGLAVWLPCLALCCIGFEFFLRRERSERAVICFCAAFFAVQLVLTFLIYGMFSTFVGVLIALCMWFYSYYGCYELAMNGVSAEKLTKGFDLGSLALVLLLFFCSFKAMPYTLVLPLALSVLLCLFALVLIRGGEQRKLRSLAAGAAIVAVFAVAAAVFIALASGGIKRLLQLSADILGRLIKLVFSAIDAVFRFLMSLLPQRHYDYELDAQESLGLGAVQEQSLELVDPQTLIAVMIASFLALFAAVLVYKIIKGGGRRSAVYTGGERGIKRSRTAFLAALKKAAARLFAGVVFKLRSVLMRNTAQGLYWQIEKRSLRRLHGRAKGESCREFLARATEVYPHAAEELALLADTLDEIFFGGAEGLSPAEIIKMRRRIFGAAAKETGT